MKRIEPYATISSTINLKKPSRWLIQAVHRSEFHKATRRGKTVSRAAHLQMVTMGRKISQSCNWEQLEKQLVQMADPRAQTASTSWNMCNRSSMDTRTRSALRSNCRRSKHSHNNKISHFFIRIVTQTSRQLGAVLLRMIMRTKANLSLHHQGYCLLRVVKMVNKRVIWV